MNPQSWLKNTDLFERSVLLKVAKRREELLAEEREDLAIRIINNLGKSIKGS